MVKNPPVNAGDIREAGWIPGSGRSFGEEYGNPLQCSCLESPMDRGVWQAIIQRVTQSRTLLKRLGMSTHISTEADQQQTSQTALLLRKSPLTCHSRQWAVFTGLVLCCSLFNLPSEGPVPFDFRQFFVSQKPCGVDMELVRTTEASALSMLSPVGLPGTVVTTRNTNMGRTFPC